MAHPASEFAMQPTILIIDDEKHTRDGLRASLEDSFDVYVAASGVEARAVLEREHVDLVLTDLRLGGEDGMALIEEILKRPQPPVVIMMTAYGSVDAAVEANHRIANNLASLVALFTKRIPAIETGPEMVPREQLTELIRDVNGRINALGRLHHLLSVESTQREVDVGAALSNVIEGFRTTGMFDDRLDVRLTADIHRIDATQASMLMLVMAEIATNAVKYAHPSGLPVEFTVLAKSTPAGKLILHFADDGVGLPEGFDEARDAGPGLRLVRKLVESTGGRLTMKSNPLGLRFTIELPPRA